MPKVENVNHVLLQEYLLKNHKLIRQAVNHHGAVLFKGFDIVSGHEFSSVINCTGFKETKYTTGAAIRRLIVGSEDRMENPQVLTTNEAPPHVSINFHHEIAHTPTPMSHISFFCHVQPDEQGATPILRSDLVFDYVQQKYPDFLN